MSTTYAQGTVNHHADAVRYFGSSVATPRAIIDAKARLYGWRPFARHTPEETAAHAEDLAMVDAYEADLAPCCLFGADPMGDE